MRGFICFIGAIIMTSMIAIMAITFGEKLRFGEAAIIYIIFYIWFDNIKETHLSKNKP